MSIELEMIQRLQAIESRLRSLERIELPLAGGGGFLTGAGVANEIAFFSAIATIASSPRIIRAASGNLLTVSAGAATDVPLLLTQHASQSVHPFQIKDSDGYITAMMALAGQSFFIGTSGERSARRVE